MSSSGILRTAAFGPAPMRDMSLPVVPSEVSIQDYESESVSTGGNLFEDEVEVYTKELSFYRIPYSNNYLRLEIQCLYSAKWPKKPPHALS